jgi:hypothetical protein
MKDARIIGWCAECSRQYEIHWMFAVREWLNWHRQLRDCVPGAYVDGR